MRRPLRAGRQGLRPLAGNLLGLVPALLVGAGVALVAAGLLNYSSSSNLPDATATASAGASGDLPSFSIAMPSLESPGSSGELTGSLPTRIVIPHLSIDLPIVASPPNEVFPLCDVAEIYSLPGHTREAVGLNQAIYLAAHARTGMFLPLLTASQKNDGAAMIGKIVEVYTDDNQNHVYEISSRVIRRVPVSSTAFDLAAAARTEELWLQTSEGPLSSSTKLQVVATPLRVLTASQADSHPTSQGRVCPDAPKCANASQTGCRR
jgi:hypothetical protein